MGMIQTFSNVWTGLKTLADSPKASGKRFDDVLLAVRAGNLEEWNKETTGKVSNPYVENYAVQTAINLLARNIAQVPMDIYKGENKLGSEFELNQVLLKPNEYTSRFELWEQTMIYFFLYGEAFWFLNTNDYDIIREIYVLHPKYMKAVQSESSYPTAWIYKDSIPMSSRQVIQFKLFNTTGIRGLSPLDAVQLEIDADKEAAKYNKNFFRNGARVSGIISMDKDLTATEEEMTRVLMKFKQAHQGSENAYKVGIISPGMKYDEYGQTMRDMEYVVGRDAIRDRILLVLGIHKSIVGITEKIDRATADVALRSLWQVNLKPNCIRIQEKINAELFQVFYPGQGLYCKFDLATVEELKKDLNETLDAGTKLFMMGYSRNEVNVRLGLAMPEDTDDGDTRYVPINLVPVDAGIYDSSATVEEAIPDKPKPEKSLVLDKQANIRRSFLRLQSTQERAFHGKIQNYFSLQRSKVVSALIGDKNAFEEAKIVIKLSEIFDKEDGRLSKAIYPYYKQTAEAGAKFAYSLLDMDKAPVINETVLLNRVQRIATINRTVFNQIKMNINEAVQAGETIDQIADRVKSIYKDINESKALTIARTETSSMMSESSLTVYQSEGVPAKQWLTARDGKVRDEHRLNEAKGAIPINDPFPNGERYPGENSVNCRCAIAPVVRQ